jgi:O-antigen/teichoic acid export membrane protein
VAIAAFSSAWTPYFLSFRQRQAEAPAILGRAATLYILGFGGLALLFFIFAEPVVSLMVAPHFHDTWRVVGLSACAQFLLGAFALFLPPVYFADEVKAVNLSQGLAAIACLGLNLALIPPYGATGAALALALGAAIMVGAQLLWNRARGDRYMPLTLDWPRLGAFTLLFAGIAGLTMSHAFSTPLQRWAAAGAETLILAAVLYACLGAGERAALAARLRRRGAA